MGTPMTPEKPESRTPMTPQGTPLLPESLKYMYYYIFIYKGLQTPAEIDTSGDKKSQFRLTAYFLSTFKQAGCYWTGGKCGAQGGAAGLPPGVKTLILWAFLDPA